MTTMSVKVKHWKGAYWLFINHNGKRKARRVGAGPAGQRAANAAAIKIQARLAEGDTRPLEDSQVTSMTFRSYATGWVETHAGQACKFSTARVYRSNLDRHIIPVLGDKPVTAISRMDCRTLIAECRRKGLSRKSIENISRTVSSVLSQAMEDGLITGNPAFRLGRYYRNGDEMKPGVSPLTADEMSVLLATARKDFPREYPLFLCAVRTGLRLGELLALRWPDIDLNGRFIEVRGNLVAGRLTTPKNGKTRRVDMSAQLTDTLRALLRARKRETLKNGWGNVPEWVFCRESGRPLDADNLRHRVFYKLLEKAALRRVRFHDLRHTFASLLLQNGESPAYVKEQMGHSSIQVTVDVYGHLIPGANRQAVDRLDDATGRNPRATKSRAAIKS
jgi:integrase